MKLSCLCLAVSLGLTASDLIRIGVANQWKNLNPLEAQRTSELELMDLLFDRLVTLDARGRFLPQILDRWETSPDGLTWTLHLRPGLQWQDGQPMKAKDVAETLKWRQSKGSLKVPGTQALMEYTPEVLNEHCLKLRLKSPRTLVLQDLYYLIPVPESLRSGTKAKEVIGSGPYRLLPGATPTQARLERWKAYCGPHPGYSEAFEFQVLPLGQGAVRGLREGHLHYTDIVDALKHYLIRKNGAEDPLEAHLVFTWGTLAIWANCDPSKSPMANADLRSALAELIPWKDQIREQAVRPSRMAQCFWPPESEAFDPIPRPLPDPARAPAMLDRAGWKLLGGRRVDSRGRALKLVLVAPRTSRFQFLGQTMAEEARKLGFTLECRFLQSFTEALEMSERREGDLWINAWFHGILPDVNAGWFLSGHPSNFSGYSNPEVDRLFGEASRATDPGRRKVLYQQASQLITRDMPVLPFAYTVLRVAHSRKLRHIEFDRFGRSWGFVPGRRGWSLENAQHKPLGQ